MMHDDVNTTPKKLSSVEVDDGGGEDANDDSNDENVVNNLYYNVLFEVKPYEPLGINSLSKLAMQIQESIVDEKNLFLWIERP